MKDHDLTSSTKAMRMVAGCGASKSNLMLACSVQRFAYCLTFERTASLPPMKETPNVDPGVHVRPAGESVVEAGGRKASSSCDAHRGVIWLSCVTCNALSVSSVQVWMWCKTL